MVDASRQRAKWLATVLPIAGMVVLVSLVLLVRSRQGVSTEPKENSQPLVSGKSETRNTPPVVEKTPTKKDDQAPGSSVISAEALGDPVDSDQEGIRIFREIVTLTQNNTDADGDLDERGVIIALELRETLFALLGEDPLGVLITYLSKTEDEAVAVRLLESIEAVNDFGKDAVFAHILAGTAGRPKLMEVASVIRLLDLAEGKQFGIEFRKRIVESFERRVPYDAEISRKLWRLALEDPVSSIRVRAIEALESIKRKMPQDEAETLNALARALTVHQDPEIRRTAVDVLGKDIQSIGTLLTSLKHETDPKIRGNVLSSLAWLAARDNAHQMRHKVPLLSPGVRGDVARAFLRALSDRDPIVVLRSTQRLGSVVDTDTSPEAFRVLSVKLDQGNNNLASAAIFSLKDMAKRDLMREQVIAKLSGYSQDDKNPEGLRQMALTFAESFQD